MRTSGWGGLFAPAQLPADILDIYSRVVVDLFKNETFVKRIMTTGSRPTYLAPAAFADHVRADHDYFGKVIRDLKIKE